MDNQKTIAKRYGVEARVNRSGLGYIGVYHIPGTPEHFARYPDGSIEIFGRDIEAMAAAGFHLCAALNDRSRFSYKHGYRRMGGAELAVELERFGISPSQFAGVYGTKQTRVLNWIDGAEDIPHSAHLLIALCNVPGALKMVEDFTNKTMIEKEKNIGNEPNHKTLAG